MRRALRLILYFFLGVGLSAVWLSSWAAVPAVLTFPSGSYQSQCDAALASMVASWCAAPKVGTVSLGGYLEWPHKRCSLYCDGEHAGDAPAMATVTCANPVYTPYQTGPQTWMCAEDEEHSHCGALKDFQLATAGTGTSPLISGSGTVPSVCSQGCAQKGAEQGWSVAANSWWAKGPFRYTGEPCAAGLPDSEPDTEDPTSPEAECAKSGQGWGTVNGTVVCVGMDATEKTDKKTSQEGAGKTEVETTKVCAGDECTVTTKTTHTGGGASGTETDGTTTRVSTGDRVSQGTGDGDGGGGGEDDANACRENPTSPDCLGAPPSGGEVEESVSPVGGVTAVSISGGSCPAPVALGTFGAFDFGPFCELAGLVRPAVLALAWLGAGLFLVGALKNG